MADAAVVAGEGTEVPAAKASGFSLTKFLIAVIVAVLVTVGAVGGGLFFLMKSGKLAAFTGTVKPVEAAAKVIPKTHGLALDPLLVNLADPGGQAYLRLTVNLKVQDAPVVKGEKKPEEPKKGEKSLDENEVQLRDVALTVLGTETSDQLLAPNGKRRTQDQAQGRNGRACARVEDHRSLLHRVPGAALRKAGEAMDLVRGSRDVRVVPADRGLVGWVLDALSALRARQRRGQMRTVKHMQVVETLQPRWPATVDVNQLRHGAFSRRLRRGSGADDGPGRPRRVRAASGGCVRLRLRPMLRAGLLLSLALPGLTASARTQASGKDAQASARHAEGDARREDATRALAPGTPKAGPPSDSIAAALEKGGSTSWSIVVGLTLLTLLPAILLAMTPMVRLLVVFHFLRQALGTQTAPSNQVLMGLALMMTWFLMQPVLVEVEQKATTPYRQGSITGETAIARGAEPVKQYMLRYAREKDLAIFAAASMASRPPHARTTYRFPSSSPPISSVNSKPAFRSARSCSCLFFSSILWSPVSPPPSA